MIPGMKDVLVRAGTPGTYEFFCFIPPNLEPNARLDPTFVPCDEAHPPKYKGQIGWSEGVNVIVSKDPPWTQRTSS